MIGEPICDASLDCSMATWLYLLGDGISVACFKKGSDEIIGLNVLNIEIDYGYFDDRPMGDNKTFVKEKLLPCKSTKKHLFDFIQLLC